MTAPKKKLVKKVAKPVAKKVEVKTTTKGNKRTVEIGVNVKSTPKQKEKLEEVKLPSISAKQVGRNLTVIIGKEIKTITKTTEELTPIKDLIKKYVSTPSKFLLERINKALITDKSKAFNDNKEKEGIKIQKKVIKHEIKEETKENKQFKEKLLKTLPKTLFKVTNNQEVYFIGYEIVLPALLVKRFIEFIENKQDITPLINFWLKCLLNPNHIARTKLFDYLDRHRLIITPSGNFVTYRMVKSKPDSEKTGIYVDAHTGKFNHVLGEVSKMNRKDCDEDGKNDCSKGIHTGSAGFIGISLGDGYNKGTIKTKAQGGNYGTEYAASGEMVEQKFDNTFGNQAVVCLVNPTHVVSIPNSDTRKMRSCQVYIAHKTTPEEVLNHLTNSDYYVFDKDYEKIEQKELKEFLKDVKLIETYKKDNKKKEQLNILLEKLKSLSGDSIPTDISLQQTTNILQKRIVKL